MIATDGNLSYRNLLVADVTDFNSTLNARAVSSFGPADGNVIMGDGPAAATNQYNKITNLATPTDAYEAANKKYVDDNASVGITATVTGTLTSQDIYHNTSSNTPKSVDTTTVTLPSDCERSLQVFVDVDLTSITESLTGSEDCELWIDVSALQLV